MHQPFFGDEKKRGPKFNEIQVNPVKTKHCIGHQKLKNKTNAD
jgi:hypothetical protein